MTLNLRGAVAASALLVAMSAGGIAFAQKQGGVLRMYSPDSPASVSILEEATVFAQGPMMAMEIRAEKIGQPITGLYPVPLRHGMTVGEVARYVNDAFHVGAELHVIRAEGWRGSAWFDRTGLPWVNPSPNIRSLRTSEKPMIALSGVRSSCDMLARNSDLCWLAASSSLLFTSSSRNSRAFWIARAD